MIRRITETGGSVARTMATRGRQLPAQLWAWMLMVLQWVARPFRYLGRRAVTQAKFVVGWVQVSIWLYRLLWRLCPGTLVLLSLVVLLNSLSVFAVGKVLEWTLDQIAVGTSLPLLQLALPITVVVGLVWVLEKLTKTLTIVSDSYVQDQFGTYFPNVTIGWGMACFDGHNRHFEMLTRGKRAEYSLGFFVPQQFRLFNNIARWLIGTAIVLQALPTLWHLLLLASIAVLYLQIRSAVKFTQLERKDWWPIKAERTDVKKAFDYKLRFKAIQAFGLEFALLRHIERLGQRIYPNMRRWAQLLLWPELLSILGLIAVFFYANQGIVQSALTSEEFTVGRVAFLISTMSAVGYAVQMIVNTIAEQAKGADQMVDLVKWETAGNKEGVVDLEAGSKPQLQRAPCIQFRDFSFSYKEEQEVGSDSDLIVEGLEMEFPAGTLSYLLGRNGTGKTTGLNVLSRLYEPQPNQVFVDDMDVCDLNIPWLRAFVRHMPQTPIQLRLNFRQILAFAAGHVGDPSECSEERMWQALEMACLADKVRGFRKGLDEPLGVWNRASEDLSGGQWRLTNFAMFFMAYLSGTTKALVLDEPWTNIDPIYKAQLERTLFDMDATIIVVTHEIHRIKADDNVVFLDRPERSAGPTRIAISGQHGDLLRDEPSYRHYCQLAGV